MFDEVEDGLLVAINDFVGLVGPVVGDGFVAGEAIKSSELTWNEAATGRFGVKFAVA